MLLFTFSSFSEASTLLAASRTRALSFFSPRCAEEVASFAARRSLPTLPREMDTAVGFSERCRADKLKAITFPEQKNSRLLTTLLKLFPRPC